MNNHDDSLHKHDEGSISPYQAWCTGPRHAGLVLPWREIQDYGWAESEAES